jgi:DNA invertase Pin-like site-specific DNA recombinase
MKAYSYIRWSSEKQTRGDSLERQLRRTREICLYHGWELDESLRADEGVSAYRGDNIEKGSLGRFIAGVDDGRIRVPCVLVVEAFDRLTRARLRESRRLFDSLLEKGVLICTANNGKVYDESCLDNPVDLIMSLTELNAGHEYARVLGQRSRSAWERRKRDARQGQIATRKVPAWISCPPDSRSTKDFTVISERAEVVKRIFSEYLSGIGTRTIALRLSKEGVKPFGTGKLWNVSSVFRLLKSRAVIGEYQPQSHQGKSVRIDEGPPIKGYYPAILDEKIFFEAQQMLEKRIVPRGPRKNCYNLFSGSLFCKGCGGALILKTGAISKQKKTPQISLVCSVAWRGGKCTYATIRYRMVEDALLSILASKVIKESSPKTNTLSSQRALEGQLSSVNDRIRGLVSAVASVGQADTPSAIFAEIKALEHKRDELGSSLEILLQRSSSTPSPHAVIRTWTQLPQTRDNRLKLQVILKGIIEKIVLDPKKFEGELFLRWSPQKPLKIQWDENRPDQFKVDGKRRLTLERVLGDDAGVCGMTCTLIRGDRVKHLGITPRDLEKRQWEPVLINGERLKCIRIRTRSSVLFREHGPKKPRWFRLKEEHQDRRVQIVDLHNWCK